MISKTLIDELKVILQEDYKRDLPIAKVSEIANSLVRYYDLLAKIHHQDQFINQHHEPKNSEQKNKNNPNL